MIVSDTASFWAIEDARTEEEELSFATRAMLNEICADVEDSLADLEGDLGDYAADLDEMI